MSEVASPANRNDQPDRDEMRYRLGTGNWRGFHGSGLSLEDLFAAARQWATLLERVERPWLCWNVDAAWCLVQQKLVREFGWTPIVGYDPRVGMPPLLPESICIDFNATLNLPVLWLHVPIEFTFLTCDRMAFWHADLLLRRPTMERIARLFASLPDGEMAAVRPRDGLRMLLHPKQRRYWEVIGCNTRGSSRSNFEQGCGWWMNFFLHPRNDATAREERSAYYWDCGTGIRYWHRERGGTVHLIDDKEIADGHFTGIGRSDYVRNSPNDYRRDLSKELSANNDLMNACAKMGISDLYEDVR